MSVALTRGFETEEDLLDHYQKHWAEFGAMTPDEYLAMADRFIGGDLNSSSTRECHRRNGDRVRYNEVTEEFAVMNRDGYIQTYFRPDPLLHEQGSNLNYFFQQCRS